MTNTPAGWYPDPENATQSRWWDGTRWTDNRAALQPTVAAPYAADVANLKAPEGTPWNTIWIWLVVFVPYISLFGFFTIDWSKFLDMSDPMRGELAVLTSAGYLFTVLGGIVSYGLGVWFSYIDWRTLRDRGVPRPFHWAWGFLSYVYPIGRSVVVRRRTGSGISPMWVTIILYVVANIAMIVYVGVMVASIVSSIPNISRY
ncbi:hypothetical protein BKA04_000594 [Cryobacterium mesophilum]|uniref:DUF2510 domain-containing protein n=1 Tax=Terrimesophilobacter mesophilus TaxID=433647 RepID=A0A4R8V8P5_9MICO|nr:DUF2510 domain-containing protein [Terrimesophilobacter mesophilus]MBB5632371.1 hypothetical protein [Terrimesophilobacter mesophilus]TFB79209.1 DUF2510 domain-containing protein [Terrimesophilobacter mesophilus]